MSRSPGQIIGNDRMIRLIFEGYAIVPTKLTDAMRDKMIKIADGPGRSYEEYWAMILNVATGEKAETD
jgi:hypothetical protein